MPNSSLARTATTIQPAGTVVEAHDGAEAVEGSRRDAPQKRGQEQVVLARSLLGAKAETLRLFNEMIEAGQNAALGGEGLAAIERDTGERIMVIVQRILAFTFGMACFRAMLDDIAQRGLTREQIRLRTDAEAYLTVNSSFGRITFPVFTYRDLSTPLGSVTRYPARKVLPYHRACRSTPVALEWEVRLGIHHPFRKAEEQFRFFTRGASTVEDTTIARHILFLSDMVDDEWLYRTPEEIRRVLREQATRDEKTGRPLVYVSTDAHALRRFAGETWTKKWKMVNGIRLWCEDAKTGAIIHLGGEFLWGDCREVEARFRALIETGVLPNSDEAWTALNAQLVFTSDGSEWIADRILPLLPDAIVILDPYHLIEWFAGFSNIVFGTGTEAGRIFLDNIREKLFQKRRRGEKTDPPELQLRKGHKKTRSARKPHAHDLGWLHRGRPRTVNSDVTAQALLDILQEIHVDPANDDHTTAMNKLVEQIANNALRIDYAPYLARGIQIGSGAMESMHRSGSQGRMKLAGATWLEETSRAVLRFRMLELSGRWDEFWHRNDLVQDIAAAFGGTRAALLPKPPTLAAA